MKPRDEQVICFIVVIVIIVRGGSERYRGGSGQVIWLTKFIGEQNG